MNPALRARLARAVTLDDRARELGGLMSEPSWRLQQVPKGDDEQVLRLLDDIRDVTAEAREVASRLAIRNRGATMSAVLASTSAVTGLGWHLWLARKLRGRNGR